MNYAFKAYENALQRLKEQVDEEYPDLTDHLTALQTRLQQNIAQEQNSPSGNKKTLYEDRRHILAELNTFTKQIKKISFIECCTEDDALLSYLTTTRKTVINALGVFSDERTIWPDQCKYIASNLPEIPGFDRYATTHLSVANQIKLSYLNECVAQLRELMNDFSLICQTRRGTKQREDIQHKLALLTENLKEVDETMDTFISMHVDQLNKIQHVEQKSNLTPSQESLSDMGNSLKDGKILPIFKKKPRKRRSKSQRRIIVQNRQPAINTNPALESTPPVTQPIVVSHKTDPQHAIVPGASALRAAMSDAYNLSELELLCDDLKISIENLGEGGLDIKIQHLIRYCQRRGRYEELVNKVLDDRSHLKQIFFPQT